MKKTVLNLLMLAIIDFKMTSVVAVFLIVNFIDVAELILEIRVCVWCNKKGQEGPVKEHKYGFSSLIFPNLGNLERCTS